MNSFNNTSLESIINLNQVMNIQKDKLERIRTKVRELEFKSVDIVGNYQPVAFKAIDGGMMKIYFDPLEINIIDVYDSYGNLKLRFAAPSESEDLDYKNSDILNSLQEIPIIKSFLEIFHKDKLSEISEIYNSPDTLMEIAEWACIFDKIRNNNDEPVLVMRDGLLRTKKIKSEHIKNLIQILKEKKNSVWLVGVAKRSKILTLLSTAIFMEKKIPSNSIGYIKVPRELEMMAYSWTGKGRVTEEKSRIYYAFGDIYLAKLSLNSNLLVPVEIPRDMENDEDIYDSRDINRIFGNLAKDSINSYPIIGYPQTLMRAHEYAASVGFPASVMRDKILDQIMNTLDENGKSFIRNGFLLKDAISKYGLGGGD